MRLLLILILLLLTIIGIEAEWTPEQLPSGTIYTSPNREFSATYCPDQLRIRNNFTKKEYKSITVLPVYSIVWASDSQTIVVVEHIAGGSTVVIAHFNGMEWESFTVSPPGNQYDSYSVVDLDAKRSKVRLKYKAAVRDLNQPGHYLCTFDIDPATSKVSNVTVKKISVEKFFGIKQLGKR